MLGNRIMTKGRTDYIQQLSDNYPIREYVVDIDDIPDYAMPEYPLGDGSAATEWTHRCASEVARRETTYTFASWHIVHTSTTDQQIDAEADEYADPATFYAWRGHLQPDDIGTLTEHIERIAYLIVYRATERTLHEHYPHLFG